MLGATLAVALSGQTFSLAPRPASPTRGSGLAVDAAQNIYLSHSDRHTVMRYTAGAPALILAGVDNVAGLTAGLLSRPAGLARDREGNLFVADSGNHCIRRISASGMMTTVAGVPGAAGAVDGPPLTARFSFPDAIVVDAAGNLYVSEAQHTIRRITANPVTTIAGQAGTPGSEDGPGAAARFNEPAGLALDASGNLYVADSRNFTVRRISTAGMVITVAGLAGYPGSQDGAGSEARFGLPQGIAADTSGNLFLADTSNHTLRLISPAGVVRTILGQVGQAGIENAAGGNARLSSPHTLAVDPAGLIHVLDEFTVRAIVPVDGPMPPIILSRLGEQSQGVVPGATASFTVAASGDGPLRYQWVHNGNVITGATHATLTLASVTTAQQGRYRVSVANSAGVLQSDDALLSIYTPTITSFTTLRSQPGGSFLWGIAAGNGVLVAVGERGLILTSRGGQVWTPAVSGTTDWLVGATYGGGRFVAVGDRGTILTSTDGAQWRRAAASGTTQRLNNVAFGNGRYVAVGENGTIVTSTDAETWTPGESGVTGWLRGITYAASFRGAFLATGQAGAFLWGDGTRWRADVTRDSPFDLEAALTFERTPDRTSTLSIGQAGAIRYTYDARVLVTAKAGGQYYMQLLGGSAYRTGIEGVRLRGLAAAHALFAMGERGVILGSPSPGGPWVQIPSGTTANLVSGIFFNNALYVVGENETILSSTQIYQSRLMNVSTRGPVGRAGPMISGFVVSGPSPKRVLLRAAGPALRTFGVPDPLMDVTLTLFNSTGTQSRPTAAGRPPPTRARSRVPRPRWARFPSPRAALIPRCSFRCRPAPTPRWCRARPRRRASR